MPIASRSNGGLEAGIGGYGPARRGHTPAFPSSSGSLPPVFPVLRARLDCGYPDRGATDGRHDRRHDGPHRRDRRGHAWLEEELGSRAHRRRVVGPASAARAGRPRVAGRVVRPRDVARGRVPCSRRSPRSARSGARRARHAPRGADDRRARHRRAEASATSSTSSPARRRGASCSASRAPGPTSPGSTRGGARRRRVGRQRAEGVDVGRPRSPTSACCWPAPIPTCRSTRASPTSRSTCTSPASRSGRSAR